MNIQRSVSNVWCFVIIHLCIIQVFTAVYVLYCVCCIPCLKRSVLALEMYNVCERCKLFSEIQSSFQEHYNVYILNTCIGQADIHCFFFLFFIQFIIRVHVVLYSCLATDTRICICYTQCISIFHVLKDTRQCKCFAVQYYAKQCKCFTLFIQSLIKAADCGPPVGCGFAGDDGRHFFFFFFLCYAKFAFLPFFSFLIGLSLLYLWCRQG